ncbi:NAD(P)H dehydrogenase [Malaciobacter molluscorum LMG 25693]|uniref:Flavodoxin-like fold domain-containing protein n=1 Tax=Malaciobacter molluscorum LMG 25693 TaxID=870501 RepID=A0A2G1DLZ3_9BACT|nr:NAD(P)H-dependent oxidoreductase [Malaciobacter molluscorum]AXX92137.1 flavodoxin-like fold domain-containing protein [Malaciobacter molluscorum LMG 25693]PHO19366.1 NAD(P)H dehydrogenase [Malaciobacter molluscorum LMG 25693]
MKCLVVLAHPLENSLCCHLARETIKYLENKGYQVTVKDLYKESFNPILTKDERDSYYEKQFNLSKLKDDIIQLEEAESLVLIFPTWWFSFPAILKGWFDRVWAPGHAYNHASDLGAITPCLLNLKELKVITTLGAPWWFFFVLRKPVKVLKYALLGACTKNCKFQMLSLYNSESLSKEKVSNFIRKIKATF